MLIYHYDSESGEYLRSSAARMSPLEPDVPLVPANATLLEPPEAQEGYTRVFRDGVWTQTEDTAEADSRRTAILAELAALDAQAVRSLRAVAAGTGTTEDSDKLAALEQQAAILRAELAELK